MEGDEHKESTWNCILRMHDPNEEGLADARWFEFDYLEEYYFSDDLERRREDFQTLLKLGVIIRNEKGEFIINLWWDQGPGVFVEPDRPKPRFLNSN